MCSRLDEIFRTWLTYMYYCSVSRLLRESQAGIATIGRIVNKGGSIASIASNVASQAPSPVPLLKPILIWNVQFFNGGKLQGCSRLF